MTKDEVVKAIAEQTKLEKEMVSEIVENFLTVVKNSMVDGNEIFIRGFGSFIIQKKAQKVGRNISQNTAMIIPEHYAPKFKPANEFIENIKNSQKIKLIQDSQLEKLVAIKN